MTCGIVPMEAMGQSLVEVWESPLRVVPFVTEKNDEPVALAFREELVHIPPGQPELRGFVYVTGWGTNAYGGVCIVTYKVDADTKSVVSGPVYFPPTNPATVTTTHKPTAMTLNGDGNVFVTGYSQRSQGGDFDYIDVRAVAMDTAFHGTTEVAYVAGWLLSPVSSEVPMYYMTLKYTIYPTMVIDASDFLPSPHALEAKARDVHAGFEGPAGVLKGVFVTGRQGFTSSGIDHVTVGYSP